MLCQGLLKRVLGPPPQETEPDPSQQNYQLQTRNPGHGTSHTQYTGVHEVIHHGHSDIGTSLRFFRKAGSGVRARNKSWKEIGFSLSLGSAFLVLFLIVTIGAILSSYIIIDGVALCKSDLCGWWWPVNSSDVKRYNMPKRTLDYYVQQELAAAAHEANCMQNKVVQSPCDLFYPNAISYHERPGVLCPFVGNMCLGGNSHVMQLETDFLDARVLGINTPSHFDFRRTSIFAPIIVNDSYLEYLDDPQGIGTIYYRYFDGNYSVATGNTLLLSGAQTSTYMVQYVR